MSGSAAITLTRFDLAMIKPFLPPETALRVMSLREMQRQLGMRKADYLKRQLTLKVRALV